ncbi:MAG: hypothetical protein VX970_02575 [Planctomycetota bacterium]|nr:hypothetical protein [Planctomycetota bacterium]
MPLLSARRLIVVCLFTLEVCVSQLQAAPLNPAEIPADTKWLIHFDVEKARDWKLMQNWEKQMKDKAWYRDKVSEMAATYGWNPVTDLQGISMYDSQYARFNGVLALHVQNIKPGEIAARFQKMHPDAQTETYRGRLISTWTDSSPYQGEHSVAGCLFDNSLMLIADDSQKIKSSIDVLEGKTPGLQEDSSLLDSFNRQALLACRAIDVPETYQATTRCPVLKRCQTATMFFDADDEIMQLEYDLQANNAELASKMKGAVSGMWAMMGMKMKQSALGKKMLDAVQINREGNHLRVTWQGETEDVEKMAQAMKEKKWGKMDWKQYRKKSGKKEQNASKVPKQESSESLDEWIEKFKL